MTKAALDHVHKLFNSVVWVSFGVWGSSLIDSRSKRRFGVRELIAFAYLVSWVTKSTQAETIFRIILLTTIKMFICTPKDEKQCQKHAANMESFPVGAFSENGSYLYERKINKYGGPFKDRTS
jgi:hypothetical protein